MSKSLLNKYRLDPKDDRYTNIIRILGSNLGLLDLYLGFVINDKITIDRISELNELIKKYKNLLQVNKVYPINFKNFENLDDTINNLSSCFNKEYLNNIFNGDRDSINYFIERLKNYVDIKNKYKKETKTLDKIWYKNKIDEAGYYLKKSLIDLDQCVSFFSSFLS